MVQSERNQFMVDLKKGKIIIRENAKNDYEQRASDSSIIIIIIIICGRSFFFLVRLLTIRDSRYSFLSRILV